MLEKIWFKGRVVDKSQALVPILSPTAQFGLNVFEGAMGYWSAEKNALVICHLTDHLERLISSCKLIGLECPYSVNELLSIVETFVSDLQINFDAYFRIVLFVDSNEGISNISWFSNEPVELFIAVSPKTRKSPETLTGAKACTSSWKRIDDLSMPPRVKAGANYFAGRYSHFEAKAGGYDLPILLNKEGKVAEGAGSCLFMIKKNKLVTPTTTSSILESITRSIIITLAPSLRLTVEERDLDRSELYIADEIFLCGTTAEIIPLTSLDGRKIADGQVGGYTKQLLAKYLSHGSSLSSNNFIAYRTIE